MYAFFKGTNIDISTFVPFNCQRWDCKQKITKKCKKTIDKLGSLTLPSPQKSVKY